MGARSDPDEDKQERINRELNELLEELRVAIPGAQVLFAFLLGVAFTQTFHTATALQRTVYFATLLLTAAATALLIAPSAYHRINFRSGDKEQLLFSATRMAIASLFLLMLAVAGSVFLVGDVIYKSPLAGVAGAGIAAWFTWFWFVLPWTRRDAQANAGERNSRRALR
ncbi:MAG: hypothetical protein QOJ00_2505 [Actinomycetota bacterium]